ncbi:MAG: DUF1579 domain-containing protein [Methylacidiphilales bacterium]|nr:DUF1579 domain-containing protein [Candidatus Methylacidiphilales bacterium]NJR16023.1 DUF1579 domain-containing protein [Calothrix sp. CSU_2_0]
MRAEPQNEHQWLMKLVGDWTYEVEVTMGADRPPEKAVGTESVRSLGGLWILAEGQGDMPGCGAATTIITLGYNSETKRYTGTFVGSMMTHLWVYDGELDATQKVLILDSEGPAMSGEGKMAKYRDAIEFVSEDCWTMTSYILDDNGKWQGFMTAYYQRR